MKRSPLNRRTPLRRTNWSPPRGKWKGGNRRSPAAENGSATWFRTRQWVIDRAHGRCEPKVAEDCTGRAEHVHHICLRSRGGSDDPSNLLATCHRCHDFIHRHPALATERGWMRSREAA